jgi:dethiobiotin synthetase
MSPLRAAPHPHPLPARGARESSVTRHESRVTGHRSPVTGHSFFVTGTDTGVGKTLVACALLRAFARSGARVVGMKPVAAGAVSDDGVLTNEDVVALRQAGNVDVPQALANPYCFAPPVAPHIAAREAGVEMDIARLREAFAALSAGADCVIVEGAGGFMVPLGPNLDSTQLAQALALPIVLVVGMRLGCLNHALLTRDAIARAGLRLAGWVANHIDPDMLCADENVEALRERLDAPLLARVAFDPQPNAEQVSRMFRMEALAPGA